MPNFTPRAKLKSLFARMPRAERAVLLLLCVFAAKFLFSAAAQFVPALQGLDALGSGRHPVDVWLLLLCATAVLGMFGIAAAMNGYLFKKIQWYMRIAFMVGGLMASTILAMFLMPAFYLLIRRENLDGTKKGRRHKKQIEAGAAQP